MSDDTRDIALRAEASTASAHKRLDGYNGQIAALRISVDKNREETGEALDDLRDQVTAGNAKIVGDFAKALYGDDGKSGIIFELVDIKSTLRFWGRVVGFTASIAMAVIAGVSVYKLTHEHQSQPQQSPPTATQQRQQ